jgi:uncharacterized protein with GYD domain
MPKFLFNASYTTEGVKGVQSKGGSARRDALTETLDTLGGSLESFHFAFGDQDTYAIVDLPSNEAAAALALTVNASGGITVKTTVLLTPEEVDSAAEQAVSFRVPGQ